MSENNYVQVELPKVPRLVSYMLTNYQTRDYDVFKQSVYQSVYQIVEAPEYKDQLKTWLDNGGYKKIDTAIVLGVWEIEK